MTAIPTDSLVPLRADGELPPVYCVHPVSGSPFCYAELAARLDPGSPVFGFEAPGFDGIGEPARSIRELAEVHTATLRAARPHGPYRLLGWSLGGVVAFEMARLLAAGGEEVPLLVVIDAALPGTQPFPPGPALVRHFLHDFLGLVSGGAPELDKALAALPPEAGPQERLEAIEDSGTVPEEFDAEFLLERFTLFRAHAHAMVDHVIDGVHDGPTTLVKAEGSEPHLLRWEPYASRLDQHTVPGDHHSIWREPGLAAIADVVNQALRRGASV
ncbi:alpha/beta fold hydrolase [Streptomyces sp. NPDC088755]|uniref:thioesterase domain-containing protein n=1 Tax=Streptomyces sp. NPDC088755 TaxID=3365888 RepID=UPI00381D3C72